MSTLPHIKFLIVFDEIVSILPGDAASLAWLSDKWNEMAMQRLFRDAFERFRFAALNQTRIYMMIRVARQELREKYGAHATFEVTPVKRVRRTVRAPISEAKFALVEEEILEPIPENSKW